MGAFGNILTANPNCKLILRAEKNADALIEAPVDVGSQAATICEHQASGAGVRVLGLRVKTGLRTAQPCPAWSVISGLDLFKAGVCHNWDQ